MNKTMISERVKQWSPFSRPYLTWHLIWSWKYFKYCSFPSYIWTGMLGLLAFITLYGSVCPSFTFLEMQHNTRRPLTSVFGNISLWSIRSQSEVFLFKLTRICTFIRKRSLLLRHRAHEPTRLSFPFINSLLVNSLYNYSGYDDLSTGLDEAWMMTPTESRTWVFLRDDFPFSH